MRSEVGGQRSGIEFPDLKARRIGGWTDIVAEVRGIDKVYQVWFWYLATHPASGSGREDLCGRVRVPRLRGESPNTLQGVISSAKGPCGKSGGFTAGTAYPAHEWASKAIRVNAGLRPVSSPLVHRAAVIQDFPAALGNQEEAAAAGHGAILPVLEDILGAFGRKSKSFHWTPDGFEFCHKKHKKHKRRILTTDAHGRTRISHFYNEF